MATKGGAWAPAEGRRLGWRYRALVKKVRAWEARQSQMTEGELRESVTAVRQGLREGGSLEKYLPRVFGLVCVAAWRALGMRPYDVQLAGGYELHRGRIAEMATGEGKTLVATLPAVLNAISGKGVHVVTVNDYLAQRDAELMGPVCRLLGLTVGVIVAGLSDEQRRAAYRCDVVYGTNKELGFDYLRDQIKLHEKGLHRPIDTLTLLGRKVDSEPVMRGLHYAIVDEADSVLIDEARTPLIIAGASELSPLAWAYQWADGLARWLRPRHDFTLKTDKRQLEWTEAGRIKLERLMRETGTPSVSGESWPRLVLCALRARWLFVREQHYVVAGDQVVIVDEFTGRRMPGRTWNEGLHQAVQAREGLPIMTPSQTLARTTYQHFFGLYATLAGMTGTAATEKAEFRKVFGLRVRGIPTHRPVRRKRLPEQVYRTSREKWLAVVREVEAVRAAGRPVLVGTHGIEQSELLSQMLTEQGIAHDVLNARPEHAGREAQIVARAGQAGAVTIATNMAGRGTDIKLGPGVAAAGGLHVIGTERHESRRVDRQLIGRCARQGDPGSYRFVLSLQDALLKSMLDRRNIARLRRRQATTYGRALGARRVRRLFAKAQIKVEKLHYRMRQQLMEYEDWLSKVYYQMGA